MTYTAALCYAPAVLIAEVRETMEEAGYDDRFFITTDDLGRPVNAIDMTHLSLVPNHEDDRDTLINSGRLSDAFVATGEEAFIAGCKFMAEQRSEEYDAGLSYRGWSEYIPSDLLLETQSAI